MGSRSSTASATDSRSIGDDSIVDLQGADGNNVYKLSNVMDSDVNLTMLDGGAIDASYAAVDGAINAMRQQSSEAIRAATSATSEGIKAVVSGTKGDTQAVLGDFAKWGAVALIGLALAWAVVKKG